MQKIMVIEDDLSTRQELEELLKTNGYQVVIAKNFQNLVDDILIQAPDLVLLDINIPNISGDMILKNLRTKTDLPVIMVTSRNEELDEALSITYGADDYITKPYNPTILLLRIGAVLKRFKQNTFQNVTSIFYKDLEFDTQKGIIKKNTKEIELTKNEMLIFSYFLTHQNKIVTRDELMTILWDNSEYVNENALTVNISRLRTKLTEMGYPNAIHTRKRIGYILL